MRLDVRKGNWRTQRRCRRTRVFLDEVDVTSRTFALDTREGWVRCYAASPNGTGFFVGRDGDVAWEQRHGRVRVERIDRGASA